MHKYIKRSCLIFVVILLSACSTNIRFYPVQGPLAKEENPPVLVARMTNIRETSGKMTVVMPDGERCEGIWSASEKLVAGLGAAELLSTNGKASDREPAATEKIGTTRGDAVLKGEKGTTIEIEFYTESGKAHGYGLARDNHWNIYRVVF